MQRKIKPIHCKRGHALTVTTTYIDRYGYWNCLLCKRFMANKIYKKRKLNRFGLAYCIKKEEIQSLV